MFHRQDRLTTVKTFHGRGIRKTRLVGKSGSEFPVEGVVWDYGVEREKIRWRRPGISGARKSCDADQKKKNDRSHDARGIAERPRSGTARSAVACTVLFALNFVPGVTSILSCVD